MLDVCYNGDRKYGTEKGYGMKLAQELPLKMREQLQAEAARRGQDPDALILSLVAAGLSESPPTDPVAEEEAERFARWADSRPRRDVPVIPLEALDREHIYGDFD